MRGGGGGGGGPQSKQVKEDPLDPCRYRVFSMTISSESVVRF